ncbi:cytochrome c oxidase copper chaperone [Anopheles cruzii]|uniref:cytochrome c oxidase copper chaperone n=1 Tax=Anopheles cruzii TaxID=68878 RepID=UPI0022EC8C95|nr:cytochrome c oxidase copper chaperone [Anopheles cruzii]
MSSPSSEAASADEAIDSDSTTTTGKPKCKSCCACPETRKARDECILENGVENCSTLIERHKQCMRNMGFNI